MVQMVQIPNTFNAGLNSTMLEGAQLSGGSRAVELGLITHTGTFISKKNVDCNCIGNISFYLLIVFT